MGGAGERERDRSFSVKAPLDQLRLLPAQPTVSLPPPHPPGHRVCVTGLNAAWLNQSLSSAWLQVKLILKGKSSDPESGSSAFSPPGEEQNKEALQDVEDEAQ